LWGCLAARVILVMVALVKLATQRVWSVRSSRTVDLAIGERREGPIPRRRDGKRLDRRTAHRWVRSIGKRAGLGAVHPHMLRAAFITAALDAGVPLRDGQLAGYRRSLACPLSPAAGLQS
jgi:site-specific recombinase XerD